MYGQGFEAGVFCICLNRDLSFLIKKNMSSGAGFGNKIVTSVSDPDSEKRSNK